MGWLAVSRTLSLRLPRSPCPACHRIGRQSPRPRRQWTRPRTARPRRRLRRDSHSWRHRNEPLHRTILEQSPKLRTGLPTLSDTGKSWRSVSDPAPVVRGLGMTLTYADRDCSPATRITRSLLGYGVIAGPLYVLVALAQALTRDGFDLSRHAWSLLANGDWCWIQTVNFVVTGAMTVAAAVGLRRAAGGVAPVLIGVYGLSLVGAGVFRADPAQGFPVGAPETTTMS